VTRHLIGERNDTSAVARVTEAELTNETIACDPWILDESEMERPLAVRGGRIG
jgi:hypothetical protein